MIYILSGVAKSGKSTLTKEFHRRTHIPYISTDSLMMMLHYAQHPENLDIDASDSSVATILEPYIYGLIKSFIDNHETYIIEGVHFNTSFAKQLIEKYPNDINIIYLGYKDCTVLSKMQELERYKSVIPNQWYAHLNSKELHDLVVYMISESQRIYEECVSKQLKYIEVYHIIHQMDDIIEEVQKKIT